MEQPIGPEVSIHNLVPGTRYYGFSMNHFAMFGGRFRGKFTEYYINYAGYNMMRFHETRMTTMGWGGVGKHVVTTGSQAECPHGLYLRIFEPENGKQSYSYYRISRFTDAQKNELFTRYVLYKRRQYERGLTGSTSNDKWFPRDIVREISLRYLTNDTVGCSGQWKC